MFCVVRKAKAERDALLPLSCFSHSSVQINPPVYDLSKFCVPAALFSGSLDELAAPDDVAWTISKLPADKLKYQKVLPYRHNVCMRGGARGIRCCCRAGCARGTLTQSRTHVTMLCVYCVHLLPFMRAFVLRADVFLFLRTSSGLRTPTRSSFPSCWSRLQPTLTKCEQRRALHRAYP